MDVNDLLIQARRYLENGDIEQARRVLKEATKIAPENIQAWLQLSEIVEDSEQSAYCLEKALEINPAHREIRLALKQLQFKETQPFSPKKNSFDKELAPTDKMPVCQNCRNTISKGDKYCSNCGRALSDLSEGQTQTFSDTQPTGGSVVGCPQCGAGIIIVAPNSTIRCDSCGAEFEYYASDKNPIILARENIDQLLKLAFYAEKEHRYQDAYEYYVRILEQDPDKQLAWLGKGRCLGWTSSPQLDRIPEAISYIKKRICLSPYQPALMRSLAMEFIQITLRYVTTVLNNIEERALVIDATDDSSKAIRELAAKLKQTKINKELQNVFIGEYFSSIKQGIRFSWNLYPSTEVAKGIYQILNVIMKAPVFDARAKKSIEERLRRTLVEIESRYPAWTHPEKSDDL